MSREYGVEAGVAVFLDFWFRDEQLHGMQEP